MDILSISIRTAQNWTKMETADVGVSGAAVRRQEPEAEETRGDSIISQPHVSSARLTSSFHSDPFEPSDKNGLYSPLRGTALACKST